MKYIGCSLALTAAMAVSVPAQAALLDLVSDDDTTTVTIPDTNTSDVLAGLEGLLGGHVFASTDTPIQLTFEYLFKDAELTNSFWFNGAEIFNTASSSFGDTSTLIWRGGSSALDFGFFSGMGYGISNNPDADDQNSSNAGHGFFTYLDTVNGYLLLGLDDGGNNQDADHNDMVIRVKASEVPEPASVALLGAGVLGAALTGARRKKRQQA